MTPEGEAVLHHEIGQVLRRFMVHYQSIPSADGTVSGFAVWDCRGPEWRRLSELTDQRQALSDLICVRTEAIIQLFKELAPNG